MGRHGENIRKRKDGRWEARCIVGRREDGKAIYKYLYGKTYYEARKLKKELLDQKPATPTTSAASPGCRITFGQLLNEWLDSRKLDVKESTYSRYVFLIEKHLMPHLGEIPLADMTSETINQFSARMLTEGKLRGEGGLSPKTVSGLLSIIKLVLSFGIQNGYHCPNSIAIKNPRQIKPNIQILSEYEQQQLEQHLFAVSDNIHLGIILSLYTGLRIGEVCALKWGDIDLINNTITVQRTIIRIQDVSPDREEKTKVVVERPKTECSNRVIPFPSFLVDYISNISCPSACYVLTGNESYMEPRTYYFRYKKLMAARHLEHFNYHALRHTFATRCIENDFDLKSLSEILGHANVTTTMQRYVHPSMSLKRHHMDKLKSSAIHGQNYSQNPL